MLTCLKIKRLTLDRIKLSTAFIESPPNPEKLIRKTAEFLNGAKLEPILIDKDLNLIDGTAVTSSQKLFRARNTRL